MSRKNQKRIANLLRKYRKTRGLLQKDVARVLGLRSSTVVSRWEKGLSAPNLKNLLKLAILYRTMVDTFFIDLRRILQKEILATEQDTVQDRDAISK